MTTISAILSLLKALPILDSWFKGLVLAYNKYKIEAKDKEFNAAIAELYKGDQRKLEEAAGMNPGADPDQTDIVTRPRTPHA